MPFLASRASGREIFSAVRQPVISHKSDGANTKDCSRSTRTTRCAFGSALRNSLAVTSPPTPPPRITTVSTIDFSLEHQHFVRFDGPCGPLVHRTLARALNEFGVRNAPPVHA